MQAPPRGRRRRSGGREDVLGVLGRARCSSRRSPRAPTPTARPPVAPRARRWRRITSRPSPWLPVRSPASRARARARSSCCGTRSRAPRRPLSSRSANNRRAAAPVVVVSERVARWRVAGDYGPVRQPQGIGVPSVGQIGFGVGGRVPAGIPRRCGVRRASVLGRRERHGLEHVVEEPHVADARLRRGDDRLRGRQRVDDQRVAVVERGGHRGIEVLGHGPNQP